VHARLQSTLIGPSGKRAASGRVDAGCSSTTLQWTTPSSQGYHGTAKPWCPNVDGASSCSVRLPHTPTNVPDNWWAPAPKLASAYGGPSTAPAVGEPSRAPAKSPQHTVTRSNLVARLLRCPKDVDRSTMVFDDRRGPRDRFNASLRRGAAALLVLAPSESQAQPLAPHTHPAGEVSVVLSTDADDEDTSRMIRPSRNFSRRARDVRRIGRLRDLARAAHAQENTGALATINARPTAALPVRRAGDSRHSTRRAGVQGPFLSTGGGTPPVRIGVHSHRPPPRHGGQRRARERACFRSADAPQPFALAMYVRRSRATRIRSADGANGARDCLTLTDFCVQTVSTASGHPRMCRVGRLGLSRAAPRTRRDRRTRSSTMALSLARYGMTSRVVRDRQSIGLEWSSGSPRPPSAFARDMRTTRSRANVGSVLDRVSCSAAALGTTRERAERFGRVDPAPNVIRPGDNRVRGSVQGVDAVWPCLMARGDSVHRSATIIQERRSSESRPPVGRATPPAQSRARPQAAVLERCSVFCDAGTQIQPRTASRLYPCEIA
jgi:hypothetical protein